ncbi:ABC transporter ATP-binding protein, partial [Propionicicella superfundia]|uniref:ATP-binding cassette domain-containing protein n=1 Tax=Propionicicella superfundia TaxID=348582 RepID=UPI001B7F94F6
MVLLKGPVVLLKDPVVELVETSGRGLDGLDRRDSEGSQTADTVRVSGVPGSSTTEEIAVMNITTSVAPAPPAGPHHLAREALLSVTGLTVTFEPRRHGRIDAPVEAVKGIDFEVHDGQTLAVVGESGSGKSASLLGLVGLLPGNARVAGDVRFAGRDLLGLSESELRAVRGKDIGFVFQDPSSSLHPQKTIGAQLDEILLLHSGLARRARRARVTGLLERVGIAEPQHAYSAYPFEYSGGMKQRAMIAMAIANRPRLIIADEPTTALDATVQASIVELLGDLQREDDTAIVFVNHDLAVVHQIADAVIVMQHGLIVENGPRQDVYGTPGHPYTRRLLAASALHTADAPVAERPFDRLKDPAVELVETTRRPFDRLKDPVDGLTGPADGLGDPVVELVETTRRPFDGLKDPVDGLEGPVDGLKDPVVELVEATRRPFDRLKDPADGLKDPVDGLKDPVVELVETARRPFDRLKDPVDGLGDPVDGLGDPVVELVEATRRPFGRLKDPVDGLEDPVVELVEATRRPFDRLKDPVVELVEATRRPFDRLKDPVVELVEATRRPFDGLKDPVDGLGDPVDGL